MSARAFALVRPLVCFDLETTGLDVQQDRIIEIACVKRHPDGRREVWTRRINPERPIAPDASAVHGIKDEDVARCPTFGQLARELSRFLYGCDLTGYNVERFDLPLLKNEFRRLGITFPDGPTCVIDSCRLFFRYEPRNLAAALRLYTGRELVGAHGAEADAVAALDVLEGQLRRYDDLPADVAGLEEACHPREPHWIDDDGKLVWVGDEAALGFGKHKNKTLRSMVQQEPDYLRWMAGGNFADLVRQLCEGALTGQFPRRGDPAFAPKDRTPPAAVTAPAPVPRDKTGQALLF